MQSLHFTVLNDQSLICQAIVRRQYYSSDTHGRRQRGAVDPPGFSYMLLIM